MNRTLRWILVVVVALAVAVPAGTYAYIHWFTDDAPERLALDSSPGATSTTLALDGGLDGAWTPAAGSQVGYRVNEVLFGQEKETVGRTGDVTGTMTIAGTTVSSVTVVADLTTVSSDEDRRDGQFHGRIMDTANFPTATFELTAPIELPDAEAETVTVDVTGELTVRGTTRPVTFRLQARRTGGTIEVTGAIPIVFADYGIPNPSFGPVTTEDHGELEFLVAFTKAR